MKGITMEWNEIEVFVMVDENGDYVTTTDESELTEKWEEVIGNQCIGSRVLKITLKVEKPRTVELTADVPLPAEKIVMNVS